MRTKEHQPSVLVLREKHATVYMRAGTLEELHASALAVLQGRVKAGYWYPKREDIKEPAKPSMTKEQVAALPDGPVKKAALQELAQYRRDRDYNAEALQFIQDCTEALEEQDGESALQLLRDRSDGEYEGIRVEPLQDRYA